jgi:peptide/nickel transport system permease protein
MSMVEQQNARERLGLDEPLPVQYEKWLYNAVHGDFGISFKYRKPAIDILSALIGNTLLLGITAYGLVFLLAILLAVLCALHEDTWLDRIICKLGTIVYYLPPFWLGLLLILLFSVNLHWLPSGGAYDIGQSGNMLNRLQHMLLPLIVMVTSHLWYYAYMIRNKLLDEIRKDYVLLAKMKGLTRQQIVWRHCLRNVAPSIISIMAISVTHVLGGTYVVEAVFSYPGIGALSIESAKYHDYNLLMLVVLVTGALVVISSLVAQTINECIDPRMQEGVDYEKKR